MKEGKADIKIRGQQVHSTLLSSVCVCVCFDAEFQGDGRMMPRNRPENAEERTAPFLLFLPLQRSKLREALGATHHKSATSTAAAAAKSCLNLCEKLKPLGKLFVFSFLRLKV